MESSAIFRLCSPPSFLTPKPNITKSHTSIPWKFRTSLPTHLHCGKMFVPGFGEASPEAQAADNLHQFFTYIAVKIVSAQLESYNPEAYKDLMEFLDRHSLKDGDKFCADLMRESPMHKSLALRILEVRSAYCKNDFEWDNLNRLAVKMVKDSNTKIMRDYVKETSQVES
ncbi:chaperonin-like RBCX protein 1, chloroplastic [Chenopodium quinoa]|uniref:chaperonin-like RBCX protein 1, chloroplastic n=1 Tax=Chenopodium quinoa TaxID=63459 RepID=UPI000B796006|nr:chaperonin-like RBCX protein 1, chloroplastic [Chenopodium quinoa]